MKFITNFIIAFFACLAPLWSQSDPMPYQVERHVYYSRYKAAQEEVDRALQARQSQSESAAYAVALTEAARLHSIFCRFQAADSLLTKAMTIFEKQGVTADSNYFKATLLLSNNCRSLGDYRKAENLIKTSPVLVEKCAGTPHAHWKVPLLSEFSILDRELCRYQDAELHLNQQLTAVAALFSKKDVRYGSALVGYANLLINLETRLKKSKTDDRPNAEDLLKEARKILEPLVAQYPVEYLALLYGEYDLYGSYYLNRPAQAAATLEKIETVVRRYLGNEHFEMVSLLCRQGARLQYYSPDFRKSIERYAAASQLCEKIFGKNVGLYIGIQQNIADWYRQLGYADTAVVIRKAALQQTMAIYGTKSASTAALMLAVANDLNWEGSPVEADSVLSAAEKIYKAAYNRPIHTAFIEVLEKRADLSRDNRTKELEWINKALDLRETMYGRQSPQYYYGLHKVSNNYLWSNQYAKADSLITVLIRYYVDNYGANYPGLVDEYRNKTLSLLYQKKSVEAEQYLNNAFSVAEKNYGQASSRYINVGTSLVQVQIDQQKYAEAEASIAHFEALIRRVYGDTSQNMVFLLGTKKSLYEKIKTPAEELKIQAKKIELQQIIHSNKSMYCYSLCDLAGDLYRLGQRKEADSLIQLARTVVAKHYPKSSRVYGFVQEVAGSNYMWNDEFKKAEACFQEYAETEKSLGNNPLKDDSYLVAMANLYRQAGRYREAEQILQTWSQLPSSQNNQGFYNHYGQLLSETDRFTLADSMYRRGLEIAKVNNLYYGHFYGNLSVNYSNWGRVLQSLDMAYQALKETEKNYGKVRPEYATACINYATSLSPLGHHTEAETYFREAMAFYHRANLRESSGYAQLLSNYATLLQKTGQIKTAIDSAKVAISIKKRKVGDDHPDYINQLINLRALVSITGDYRLCDSLSQLALAYWKKRDSSSSSYANTLESYADHLIQIGQYERALPILKKAFKIQLTLGGNDNISLGIAHTLLSKAHQGVKQYTAALDHVQEVMRIDSLRLGVNHLYYSFDLTRLGDTYISMGNYAQSIDPLLRSIVIKDSIYQHPHTFTGKSWELLAKAYQQLRQYKSAEEAARKAVAIQREVLGENNLEAAYAQQRLASILLDQGKTAEAEKLIESGRRIFTDHVRTAFGYMPLSQQQALLDKFGMIDFAAALGAKRPSPRLASLVYDHALLLKGVVLQNTTNLRDRVEKGGDQALLKTYDTYIPIKNTIAALYRLSPTDRQPRLDSLLAVADGLEQKLLKSPVYAAYVAAYDVRWAALQKALRPGEAAVEFIVYKNPDVPSSDTLHYAALVIRPEWAAPKMVYLFQEQAIANRLLAPSNRDVGYVAALYKMTDRGGGVVLTQKNADLYQLIWQPIDSMLKGAEKVWYSPAGLLHRINFAALPYGYQPNSSEILWLSQKYQQLQQVRSTRQITERRDAAYANVSKSAVLFGGIDFGQTPVQPLTKTRSAPWTYLNASKYEVDTCAQKLVAARFTVNQQGQKSATAEAFIQPLKATPSPRVVHAATHAYFAPDPLKNRVATTDIMPNAYEPNPLLRSALVFANANQVADFDLRTGKNPHIVTAQDIANLDLRNTELVILSACETGLGDVHNSEGVYGLQRAFLQAGARYVMMSLWKVNDPATAEFMKKFYGKWLNGTGKSVRQAFEETQKEMREHYKDDVYRWGAFILIE